MSGSFGFVLSAGAPHLPGLVCARLLELILSDGGIDDAGPCMEMIRLLFEVRKKRKWQDDEVWVMKLQ